jgi:hypothetical protein
MEVLANALHEVAGRSVLDQDPGDEDARRGLRQRRSTWETARERCASSSGCGNDSVPTLGVGTSIASLAPYERALALEG